MKFYASVCAFSCEFMEYSQRKINQRRHELGQRIKMGHPPQVILLKGLIIKEGSQSYKFWKDIPVPLYLKFYFFNVTNPDEFYDLEKPILEQVGPYVFREDREKVNVTWNENGTVSYKQIKRWYYEPDKTVGSLSDPITTLNAPFISAATKGKALDQAAIFYSMEMMFSTLNCTWLVTKTVEEFLFKGYDDELMKLGQEFVNLPYDKFGWFYKKNNTVDGEFVVYTGEDDIRKLGEIDKWNNQKSVTAYAPPCNEIKGTAGDMWHPYLTDIDKPTMFIPDVCRSLSFSFLKETKVNNIKTYRYWTDATQFDNGQHNPENKCFCSGGTCLPTGAVNISACKHDAPCVVSYPHFLLADPTYRQGVVGMKPNPEEHMTYLDLIPEMGVLLGVAARLQINMVFDKIKQISQFSNITRRTYFPMFWCSVTATAEKGVTDRMTLALVTVPLIANVVSFILVAAGSFLVLSASILALLFALGKREHAYSSAVCFEPEKEDKEII